MNARILNKKNSFAALAVPIVFAWMFVFAIPAYASTLTVSPTSVQVSAGNIISVKVLVNTDGDAINTAAATIHFPPNLLQVMSVSQSSSVFSLWVQNPSFSNSAGTITFTGGVPNPGFTGQNGQIMSVIFRALKPGSASLIFSDSSVLKNDGSGTDDLTSAQPALVAIGPAVPQNQPSAATTQVSNSLTEVPVIVSQTDPDQDAWYSTTSASFSWTVPHDVASTESVLSKNPNAVPTVDPDNSVSERTIDAIADGVWYFNLRYVNASGWGPTASYKVQIDSTPPEQFALNVVTQNDQNVVALDAVDAMSGIDSYSVAIDGQPPVLVQQSALVNGQYVLPKQNPGNHNLLVIAYDKAGNSTQSTTQFASPAIAAVVLGPVISLLSFAVPALALLLVLLLVLYAGWHKFFGLKHRLNKEVRETATNSHRVLMIFKEEMSRQLKQLEKISKDRELSKKEEKIEKELADNIDDVDAFLEKIIKKISF